jgi:hypothetical protein
VPPRAYYFGAAPSAKKTAMTNDFTHVHHLTACDLVVSARAAAPKRRPRKPTLTATLKAARRAGADRVEIVDGKIVITLVGKTATGTDPPPDAGANEWDDVLPGGDHGAH